MKVLAVTGWVVWWMVGCTDPADKAPAAQVSQEPAKTAAGAASAPTTGDMSVPGETSILQGGQLAEVPGAERLLIMGDGSSVGFTGSKVTGSHDAIFKTFVGQVDLFPDAIERSRVAMIILMQTVEVEGEPRLTEHLKTADFFDVATFQHAEFLSTQIQRATGPQATHTITGTLNLHGVTKTISFPANITVTPSEVRATAEFSINRKDFNILYPGKPDDLIRDRVVIRFNVRAARRAPPA